MGAGIGWAWGMGWGQGNGKPSTQSQSIKNPSSSQVSLLLPEQQSEHQKVLSSNSVAINILHAQTIIDRYTHYTPKLTQSHNTQELFSNPVYGYEMILLSHLALSNIQIRPLSSAKYGICTLQTNLGWNFSPCI